MSLDIDCPQCGHIESIDEDSLPQGEVTLVCKQCRYKWPFHKTGGLGLAVGLAPPPKPGKKAGRKAPEPVLEADAGNEVTCPGCGLTFEVGQTEVSVTLSGPDVLTAEMAAPEPARRAKPKPKPKPKPKRPRRADGKKTILVVEDVDYFVQLARETLGSKYHTVVVKTVEEAFQAIEREPVDLMVLDLTLNENDGDTVLERLEPKEFPVLIATSRDETEMYGEVWEELKRLGADDLVIKGMNMEETLLQKISSLLGVK